jgi:hypothetical protein
VVVANLLVPSILVALDQLVVVEEGTMVAVVEILLEVVVEARLLWLI